MDIYRTDRTMALVALGGNALIRLGEKGTIEEQEKNAKEICGYLMSLVRRDYNIIMTHGNGPQVGNLLLRNETSREVLPSMPLDVLVAETEGSMGYMLQQALLNHLRNEDIQRYVVTVITQVLVDRNDPAFAMPSKPIGLYYPKDKADEMMSRFGWKMIEDSGHGWRRIVPSPKPLKIIQRHMIRHSAMEGNIVIAGGGGGIPVQITPDGHYEGIEAVIDKDLTASNLASEIKADIFIILMPQPRIYVHYGTAKQKALGRVTLSQIKDYLAEGHFPPGNIGPKVTACINFVERGGKEAFITCAELLEDALEGGEGTHIVP